MLHTLVWILILIQLSVLGADEGSERLCGAALAVKFLVLARIRRRAVSNRLDRATAR